MEQIEQDVKECSPTAGDVESPQQHQKLFKNFDSCLDYLKWTQPTTCHIQHNVVDGVPVIVLDYIYSNGSK